ncbi:hypothetical protein VPJG_00009 [Vibrio phage jenny 12G5]|nr:hypothetical protein VPJG_00009 [Vibrio phage jenny 12G5]
MKDMRMSDNQESVSREHMSKMIRTQTVVMKQLHEDNLALQQENAELREFLQSLQLDVSNEIKLEQLLNKNN